MTQRSYRNTPPRSRGSRIRPDLFAAPKHFEKHGKPLSAEKLAKAVVRYGVRPGLSHLRRSDRKRSAA